MMRVIIKYLEVINIEIDFINNMLIDINKYVDKVEKLVIGIECCWDIFLVESCYYFINIVYGFIKVSF